MLAQARKNTSLRKPEFQNADATPTDVLRRQTKCPRRITGRLVGRASELSLHHSVRIDDEFLRRAFVEILIALRSVLETDQLHVRRLRDLNLVVQDRLHELA